MLEAKVKSSMVTNTVTAFGGHEYVKYEWRPVPQNEKCEKQAQDHPMLITQMKNKVKKATKRGSKKKVIKEAIAEESEKVEA